MVGWGLLQTAGQCSRSGAGDVCAGYWVAANYGSNGAAAMAAMAMWGGPVGGAQWRRRRQAEQRTNWRPAALHPSALVKGCIAMRSLRGQRPLLVFVDGCPASMPQARQRRRRVRPHMQVCDSYAYACFIATHDLKPLWVLHVSVRQNGWHAAMLDFDGAVHAARRWSGTAWRWHPAVVCNLAGA